MKIIINNINIYTYIYIYLFKIKSFHLIKLLDIKHYLMNIYLLYITYSNY